MGVIGFDIGRMVKGKRVEDARSSRTTLRANQ